MDQGRIIARLERCLEVEFTFIDVADLAKSLGALDPARADFLLAWTERIASTRVELAHRFIRQALPVVERRDLETLEAWALHALDCYDRVGLRAAMEELRNLERFVRLRRRHADAVAFDEVSAVLANFLRGLSGRPLKLEEAGHGYTDSAVVYLPAVAASFARRRHNFGLMKCMTAVLWAQTRYGTFRALRAAHPPDRARTERYMALENRRLEARLKRELPGLHREMLELAALEEPDEPPAAWRDAFARVGARDATPRLSLELAARLDGTPPPPRRYHGGFDVDAALRVMERRVEREKAQFRVRLAELLEDPEHAARRGGEFAIDARDPDRGDAGAFELRLDDAPLAAPASLRRLVESIRLDLGGVPPDYLSAAGPGEYDPRAFAEQAVDADEARRGLAGERGVELYDEWDHGRRHYRKDWCVMRERSVTPLYDGFVDATLARHAGLLRRLRRTFEAMRDEDRLLRRQPYGDDVDIDAVVQGLADARRGRELTGRLFTRMCRAERNIAVAFLVDMSGSTRGWINDAERAALLLLCEALEHLGDRYAIYGFTSLTRKRCDLFHVKRFEEPYDDVVRARIGGIRPHEYTRMGFAVRHLTRLLVRTPSRTRMLITLSDGKPDDYSDYHGEYGIEDTRRALLEARRRGVHAYCITIDESAGEYLPRLYGHASYTVVDDVRDLPLKVSDVYRRITT